MKNLNDYNIIYSGVNGYLNSHLVKTLLNQGAKVYGIDLNAKKIRNNKNYFHFKCNITNEDEIKRFYEKIKNIKIDVLINGAAINPKISKNKSLKNFSNYSIQNWKNAIDVNLIGAVTLTKYVCKIFEKNNFVGNIINISSIYGVKAPDQRIYAKKKFINKLYKPLEYGVSKSALESFSKGLSSYYQNTNIRVNTFSPGGVYKKNQNKYFKENYSKKTVLGRMAKINDYDETLIYLCKRENKYLNGSNIIIDGGASII